MKLLLTTAANLALLLLFGLIVSGHPPKDGSDDKRGQSAGPQLSHDGKATRQPPPQSDNPSPAKSEHKSQQVLKASPKQPKSKSPSPKQLKQNSTPNHSKHISPNSTPNNSKYNSLNSTPNNSKYNSPNSTPNHSKHNSPNSTPKKLIKNTVTLSPAASNKNANTNSPIGSPNPSANAENVVSPLEVFSRHLSPKRTPNSPNSSNETKRSPTYVSLNFNSKESPNNLLSESSSVDSPASLRTISASHFSLKGIERSQPFVPALSVPTRIPTPFPSALPSPQPLYTPTLFPPPKTDSQNSSPEEIPFGWETPIYSAEKERSLYSETIHVRQVNVRDARHFILEMFTELVNFYTQFNERSIGHELLHYNANFLTIKMSTEYGPELSSIMDEFWRRCMIKFGGDQFESSSEIVSPQQICMMGTLLTIAQNISGKLHDYEQLHVEYKQPTSSRSSQRTEHGSSYGDRSNLSFVAEASADPEGIETNRTMSPAVLSSVSGEGSSDRSVEVEHLDWRSLTPTEQNQEMPMPSTTSHPMVINPANTAMFGCMQFVTPFLNSVLADWKAAVITADMTLHALSELSSPEFVELVDNQIKLFADEQRTSMSRVPVDQN